MATFRLTKFLARQESHPDVDAQNKRHQNQSRSPGLRVPFVIWRNRVVINLHSQRSDRLVQIPRKKAAEQFLPKRAQLTASRRSRCLTLLPGLRHPSSLSIGVPPKPAPLRANYAAPNGSFLQ